MSGGVQPSDKPVRREEPNDTVVDNSPPRGTISNNDSFGSRFRSLMVDAAGLASDVGNYTVEQVPVVAGKGLQKAKELAVQAKNDVQDGIQYVSSIVLESMAGNPENAKSLAGQIKQLTPFVSATTKYAEAWKEYHDGKEKGDEAAIRDAKVKTLLAFAEGGVDIGLFGVARAISATKVLGRGIGMLTFARTTPFDNIRVGIIERMANKVLDNAFAQKIITGFLEAIKPQSKA